MWMPGIGWWLIALSDDEEVDALASVDVREVRDQPADDERADRVEGDVAEVQQAGEADHDVQAEGHDRRRPASGSTRSRGRRGRRCREVERVGEYGQMIAHAHDGEEAADRGQVARRATGAQVRLAGSSPAAHPSRVSSPKRPCGPEDHDHDRGSRTPRLAPTREPLSIAIDRLLDDPDDQTPDHRALEVADAAHDRRSERDQAGGEALVELDRAVVERVDQAGRARQQAAEQERQRDRAVDVDAHQARGVGVLRGRAHRLAVLGLPDEPEERDQQRDGDDDGEEVGVHDVDAADRRSTLLLRADQVRAASRASGATAGRRSAG